MARLNEEFDHEFLNQKQVMAFYGSRNRKSFLDAMPEFRDKKWPLPKDFIADVIAERNAKLSQRINARVRMGVYR